MKLLMVPVALTAFFGLTSPCPGADTGSQPPAALNLDACRDLPARFNGRVTTWDALARNYLRRVSDEDQFADRDGRSQPALRWLLDAAAHGGAALKPQLIPVDDSALVKVLKLPQRQSDAGEPPRYSPEELREAYPLLQNEMNRAVRVDPTKLTNLDRAVLTLYWRVHGLQKAPEVFRVIAPQTEQELIEASNLLAEAESGGIPQIVPPADPTKPWRSFPRASAERAAALVRNDVPSPDLFIPLADILLTYRSNDAAAFNKAVATYAEQLKVVKLPKAAFDFTVPQGWTEVGLPDFDPSYYGDVRAVGHPIAEFEVVERGERAQVRINHFASRLGTPADALNTWRIHQQLAPLPARKAVDAIGVVNVGGRNQPLLEVLTPRQAAGHTERLLAAIITGTPDAAPHAFEVSFYGDPDLADRHRRQFSEFLQSWRVGPAAELDAWFPGVRSHFLPMPTRMLAAIIPAGANRLLAFRIVGDPEPVTRQEVAFETFVRSIRLPDEPRGKPRWQLPEAWKDVSRDGGPIVFHIEPGPPGLNAELTILHEAEEGSIPQLVEAWRAMFAQPLADQTGFSQAPRQIESKGLKITLVDFTLKTKRKAPSQTEDK